jgi:uncharacterized protein
MTRRILACLHSTLTFNGLISLCVVVVCSAHIACRAAINEHELQLKAANGSIKKQLELALAYFTGDGVAQDPKLAEYWYQKAAESGDPEAQNHVGYFYEVGFGVPADAERAMHWYQLSAASGLPDAKVNIGVLYVKGIGVQKNAALAAQLFQDAAEKGDGLGATYLGTLYYFGIGVEQDKAAAEHWYTVGHKLHDPMSDYELASLYSTVSDHAHDIPKAAELLRGSADAGYVPSMHSLAVILVRNPELAKSSQETMRLLQTAISAGYWKSSMLLGIVERDGKGIPSDAKSAYLHFRIATLQGGAEARDMLAYDLNRLSTIIGDQQTEALNSQADAWFQEHHETLSFVNRKNSKRSYYPIPVHADPTQVLSASTPLSGPHS